MKKELPEGWEWKRLGDIGVYINGRAFKPSEWTKTGMPIVRIQNLTNQFKEFNYYNGEADSKYFLKNGDILISWSASLGVFLWERGDAVLNQHIFKAIPDLNIVDKNYFIYAIRNILEDMKKFSHGSTMKHIVKSDFDNTNIPIPPLETQRKIVDILEKAEATQRLRAEVDALIQKLVQSVFLDMFGDPASNPYTWKECSFDKILLKSPQNGLYKSSDFYGDGTPIMRIDSFYDGKIYGLENLKRLKCSESEIERYGLVIEDILINRVNSIEYLGKCGLIEILYEPTVFESNIMRLNIDTEIADPRYITALLCTQYVRNQIMSKAKKAVNQASINQGDVKSLEILLPPIELQNNFAKIIQLMDVLHKKIIHSEKNSADLVRYLMSKAFIGELTI
ncbi:restriction endonuclease subunit S [Methanogenium cariaci]